MHKPRGKAKVHAAATFVTDKATHRDKTVLRKSANTQHHIVACNSDFHLEVRVLVLEDLLAEVHCAKSSGLGPDQGSTVCQSAADAYQQARIAANKLPRQVQNTNPSVGNTLHVCNADVYQVNGYAGGFIWCAAAAYTVVGAGIDTASTVVHKVHITH